ncbi:MAG: hypothetical protein XD84_2185, partial [Desulfotomaculum sp. 46_80]
TYGFAPQNVVPNYFDGSRLQGEFGVLEGKVGLISRGNNITLLNFYCNRNIHITLYNWKLHITYNIHIIPSERHFPILRIKKALLEAIP